MRKYHISIFLIFFLIRVIYAIFQRSYIHPDEHFQSTEISYLLVFGKGHRTWEWFYGMRSSLPVYLYVPLYWLLRILRVESSAIMAYSPRIVQSFISSIGDYSFHRITKYSEYTTTFYMMNGFLATCMSVSYTHLTLPTIYSV